MPVGIVNVGNTCYWNTCLQCLSAIPSLRHSLNILDLTLPTDDAPVLRMTQTLLRRLVASQTPLSTDRVRRALAALSKHTPDYLPLNKGIQHDMSEVWGWWMERIHEECQAATTGAPKSMAIAPPEPFHQMCLGKWNQFHHKDTNTDWIRHYEGLLIHQVQCLKCRRCYHNPEPIGCIALDIPAKEHAPVTLADCFTEFFKTETLNEWTCDDCKTKTSAEKIVRFWKAADVLVIVLKRFGACKNKTPVEFPMEFHFLEDTVLCPEPEATTTPMPYQLMAVANHFGGMMGGHYNATVRHGDTWFHVDDDEVRPLEPTFEWWKNNNTAYVLFYELRTREGGRQRGL